MRRRAPLVTLTRSAILAAAAFAAALVAAGPSGAQEGTRLPDGRPRGSQPAEVVQRVGATEITVRWNRPTARGRVLFGGLVPWDSIWNPGADEATRIELSGPVRVNGERLPAGRYSLWAIPGPGEWTVVFSRAWDVFHRPYPEGQDALRLRVSPESAPHVESLLFHFPMATRDSARLELRWGTVSVGLDIEAGAGSPSPGGMRPDLANPAAPAARAGARPVIGLSSFVHVHVHAPGHVHGETAGHGDARARGTGWPASTLRDRPLRPSHIAIPVPLD